MNSEMAYYRPMVTKKTLRAALNFKQTENPKITSEHRIKTLELFQNNNTSAQCLLGEHGDTNGVT